MGSAVNPVLRQGNSDRRAPASVKNYAKAHPHRMGAWSPDSKTNVAHMDKDDFRSTEQSAVIGEAGSLRIELVADDGTTTVLRESVPVLAGEVVDASVMRVAALRLVPAAQIARAKAEGVLFSVHLKATMMKISDPIIFGHVVRAFFPQTFSRYGDVLAAAGSQRRTTGSAPSSWVSPRCPRAPRSGRPSTPSWPRALRWPWSTRTGDHQPARSERCHRRRVHAGHDPNLRPHVGP
jgi:monomeric type NADP-dependent isocitrate dehydrogenase